MDSGRGSGHTRVRHCRRTVARSGLEDDTQPPQVAQEVERGVAEVEERVQGRDEEAEPGPVCESEVQEDPEPVPTNSEGVPKVVDPGPGWEQKTGPPLFLAPQLCPRPVSLRY